MNVAPPEALKKPLIVPYKTLMGPGPSNCSPRVLYAVGQSVLGHMHSEVFQVGEDSKFVTKFRSLLFSSKLFRNTCRTFY